MLLYMMEIDETVCMCVNIDKNKWSVYKWFLKVYFKGL